MDAWERMFRDEEEALSFFLSQEFRGERSMTYTISIERGAECKAVTILGCASLAHALYDIETDYPGWTIVSIKEGW